MREKKINPVHAVSGFFYPYRSFRFLFRHPRLLSFVAIPFAINAFLYSGLVYFVSTRFGNWLAQLVPRGDAWYWTILTGLLWVLFAVLLFLLVVYSFTLLGNLILSPFNDLLSERVEWIHSGHRIDEPFQLRAMVKDLSRSFKAELGRIFLYLLGFLILLPLNLFPPVGTAIYAVLLPLFTLFFLGWEYFDYSMERWHLPFRLKRSLVFRNMGPMISFGAGASLLLLIPVLNFLTIPVCVIGGTLMICDLRAAKRTPEPVSLKPNESATESTSL